MPDEFAYYDLRARRGSRDIASLFPDWRPGDERLMVLSPHDDDALLGAGYALAAAMANGGVAHVCIYCDGSAGYSRPEEREAIVATRRAETARAYAAIGLPEGAVHRFEYPDFSARGFVGWKLPTGEYGTLQQLLPLLRRLRITRLMLPNGFREHVDHEATYDSGRYDGVQAGDPVLVDLGVPQGIRSTLVYAVWGDLDPLDALLCREDPRIRANRAIVASPSVEARMAEGLAAWESQGQIIQGLLAARRERAVGEGLMELYVDIDPRPRLDYRPYVERIRSIALE